MAHEKELLDLADILAKAEHPNASPEEAAIALKIAEKRAARLGIDFAVARAARSRRTEAEKPIKRTEIVGLAYDDGSRAETYYKRSYAGLMVSIAEVYDVKALFWDDFYQVTLYGFEADIDLVCSIYFAALSVMLLASVEAISSGANISEYGVKTDARVFRRTFYDGFSASVRSRLVDEKRTIVEGMGPKTESTELALLDRKSQVEDFYAQELEDEGVSVRKSGSSRKKSFDRSAWAHGVQAAKDMRLGGNDLDSGSRASGSISA